MKQLFQPLKLILVGMGSTLFATSCMMVGPDFARPTSKVETTFNKPTSSEFTAAIPESQNAYLNPTQWWASFDDPTLTKLLEKASSQNLTLQQAALRVFQMQAQLGVSDASVLPTVELSASSAQYRNSVFQEITNNSNNLITKNVVVQANWEIDFWGKLRRGVESNLSSYLSAVAAYYASDVSISADVANAYINVRNNEALIEVAKTNLALQAESLRIAKARFNYGATSMLDLSQATSQYEQTKSEIPPLIASLRKSEYALSVLLGEPPDYYAKHFGATKGALKPPPELGVGIPRDLLRRRPDVLQAEYAAAAQSALIGVNKAALFPSFTLGGIFGFATSNYGSVNQGPMFSWGNTSSGLTGGLVFPLFYRGAIIDQIRVQDAVFKQSVLAYQNQVLMAQKEVEESLITISTSKSSVEDLKKSVVAAQSAAELALERYKAGQNDYSTVISAQQSLLRVQNSSVQMQTNQLLGYVGAFKSLGGGWAADMKVPQLPKQMVSEMEDRTDWGSVLTQTGDPTNVRIGKVLTGTPDSSATLGK